MSDDAETARRIHEAWNRREDPFALGVVDEDFEYVNPPDAMERGTRRGREGFAQATRSMFESYDEVHIDIERVIDAGAERVLVLGHFRVRGRGSGVRMDQAQSYLWTFRDGRAMRVEWFWGHEAGRAAAGLDA